jgi:Carbohydrate family 9 binding domain-like
MLDWQQVYYNTTAKWMTGNKVIKTDYDDTTGNRIVHILRPDNTMTYAVWNDNGSGTWNATGLNVTTKQNLLGQVSTYSATNIPLTNEPVLYLSGTAIVQPTVRQTLAKKLSSDIALTGATSQNSFLANGNLENLDKVVSGSSTTTDLSGSVKTAWTNNGLYLSYSIKDDVVNPSGTATMGWQKDGVELMFDLDNSKSGVYDNLNDCKFNFVYGSNNLDNLWQNTGTACKMIGIQKSSGLASGGYWMDLYIPFSALALGSGAVAAGKIIGFDSKINDNDNGNDRESEKSFSGTNSSTIWNTPSEWGAIKLDTALINITVAGVNIVKIKPKIMLQGPFDLTTSMMKANLGTKNLLPFSQPFSQSTWGYTGSENLAIATNLSDAVDWILLELRSDSGMAATPSTLVARRAVILKSNGSILDPFNPASDNFSFENTAGFDITKKYHIRILHMNHLPVSTATSFNLSTDQTLITNFDFTSTSANSIPMAGTGYKTINNIRMLAGGNSNGNAIINTIDRNLIKVSPDKLKVYSQLDLNLDGNVSVQDRSLSKTTSDSLTTLP